MSSAIDASSVLSGRLGREPATENMPLVSFSGSFFLGSVIMCYYGSRSAGPRAVAGQLLRA